MSTFDPGRKYTKEEVEILDPQLFKDLKFDYVWGPGPWGSKPQVRSASTLLFEDGAADGSVLNAAAE